MWRKSEARPAARRGRRMSVLAAIGGAVLLAACAGGSGGMQPLTRATTPIAGTPETVQAQLSPTPAASTAAPSAAQPNAAAATATPAAGKGKDGKYAGLIPRFDAQQLYAVLQKGKQPVSDGAAVTAVNDPDGQLGQPGGYTSRVDFLDTSLAQPGTPWTLADGGAIEVFASAQDAHKAKQALDAANATNTAEHDYLVKTILLRLSTGISADQQSAYGLAVRRAVQRDLRQQYKAASAPSPTPAAQQ